MSKKKLIPTKTCILNRSLSKKTSMHYTFFPHAYVISYANYASSIKKYEIKYSFDVYEEVRFVLTEGVDELLILSVPGSGIYLKNIKDLNINKIVDYVYRTLLYNDLAPDCSICIYNSQYKLTNSCEQSFSQKEITPNELKTNWK